jgi:hypothetical protein
VTTIDRGVLYGHRNHSKVLWNSHLHPPNVNVVEATLDSVTKELQALVGQTKRGSTTHLPACHGHRAQVALATRARGLLLLACFSSSS